MWNFESANVKKYFGANLKKAKTNHDKSSKNKGQVCQGLSFCKVVRV